MTPLEQAMIGDLIDRVQKTQLAEKDMDAEQMLQQGMGQNPDALYVLSQTVLVQKYALEQAQAQLAQAKAQIEQLQQQKSEPKQATSFLGSLLGRNEAPAPMPPPPPQAYSQQPPPYAPVAAYPQYGAPMGMGGGGFLRGAMQTAAGVAAGALAFQGIESLMHGFGNAAGYGGQGLGGFGGGERPVEEVVNNYYGDERGEHGVHEVSAAERAEGNRQDLDYGGRNDRDLVSTSGGDRGSDFDSGGDDGGSNLEDASFDDGGFDFGDDSSGGGDGDSFA
jgi:hypothetical protein